MATVRITNEIRQYVRARFMSMFHRRIEEKTKQLQHLGIANACYEAKVPQKYRDLAAQLNQDPDGGWIEETTSFMVEMKYTTDVGTEKVVVFSVPFKPPVPLPQRLHGRYSLSRFQLTEELECYQHAKKVWLEVDQLTRERDNLISTIVDGVLTQCSTLRQVLLVWPTALDFMPEAARQQHYAKTEKRSSNPAADIQIDDSVKVALMKARMTEGS